MSLNSGDLLLNASKNIFPTTKEILEIYADPKNWGQINDPKKGCTWTWHGPTICPYDLASFAIKEIRS